MSLPMFLSYWEGKLTLSPYPDDERFIGLHKLSVCIEDRTVLFFQDDDDGHIASPINRERNGGLGLQFSWNVEDQPWARFMRHELEFKIDGDGHFVAYIDPDHKLPWPKLHTKDETELQKIAEREFLLRTQSAYNAGGKVGLSKFIRSVPDNFRLYLSPMYWMNVITNVTKD